MLIYNNSHATLTKALIAAKLGIRVEHVKTKMQNYHRNTPNEMNHIVIDHVSSLHFYPTEHAIVALAKKKLTQRVHNVNDTLLDIVLYNLERARAMDWEQMLTKSDLDPKLPFAFATMHHAENTSNAVQLTTLIDTFSRLNVPLILPLHPLTQKNLTKQPDLINRIKTNVQIVDPLRPLKNLALLLRAQIVLTDSKNLQREAFYTNIPCVTLRDDTEWIDTLDLSANRIMNADAESIVRAIETARRVNIPKVQKNTFDNKRTNERIIKILDWPTNWSGFHQNDDSRSL